MLFAASFGEAVANPDPWQNILGGLMTLASIWLGVKFPMVKPLIETILKALGVNLNPSPAPVDPAKPTPVEPQKLTIAQLVKLLLDMLAKRKQASKEDDDAIKALAEVAK
jgi:hypothetical protein